MAGTDIESTPGGHVGIETRGVITFSEGVVKGRITLERFVDVFATNPARILGMYPQKGVLAEGSDADIVLWDSDVERWTITIDELAPRRRLQPLGRLGGDRPAADDDPAREGGRRGREAARLARGRPVAQAAPRPGARRRPRRMSFKQELVGLFGQPVAENPTQVMVEAAFRELGLDWRYLTLEVAPDALGDAVRGARAFGFRGFHCTIPHKVAVIPHLDRLGEAATRIGAVNTVVRHGDELLGENTDGKGFMSALERRRHPRGAHVVVLGAGGAARAVAVELLLAGAGELTIVNRSEERGRALAEGLGVTFEPWRGDFAVPPGTDVLVNATSLGLFPNVDERVPVTFAKPVLAADVVPNPPQTRFLREAAEAGCETIDGLEMLVEQGALSVRYWTGEQPDTGVMGEALAAVL